ncbi:hypothetical protein MWU52_06935 [Jannaschia sp. S6380]|uniref:hypothetical protein n=1 Tax=Jannaschia sp. S6380 TaxID=2926408 RepID=UPI001FF6EC49|nr:hypothetical protein [Jannaschia sp. S6380]MCK0167280.1 hypothetical protein [Jannaschia sp. S6380]
MGQGAFIGIDARIWQAVIAGGVVAAGWLVNGWRMRRDARRLRNERLRDAHKALFAEIRDICAIYWLDGRAEEHAADLIARMEREPEFVPFIPREVHGLIYQSMMGQIDVLPRQTIDWIVAFYTLIRSIEALADDMRGERFPTLEPERRLAVYGEYIEMRRRAFGYGQRVLKLIDVYSRDGADAAQAMVSSLSTPDAGRSGPERPDGD